MAELTERLSKILPDLEDHLVIGKATTGTLLRKIERQEDHAREDFYDEQVWTFLVAVGYAAGGDEGVAALVKHLTGGDESWRPGHRIWFEVLPMPPREREGNTNVDLAVGDLRLRQGVTGGVQLDPSAGWESWVCLVEAKWYSDVSTKTTHHPERNQLARVAENAVCLQANGVIVDRPHVALLTPKRFRENPIPSRLYSYKFHEYRDDPAVLVSEWQAVSESMPERHRPSWRYPDDVATRADRLGLHWSTYEELLSEEHLPASRLQGALAEASLRWNGS